MWPDAVDALERIGVADAAAEPEPVDRPLPALERAPAAPGLTADADGLLALPRRPARRPRRGVPDSVAARHRRVDRADRGRADVVVGADGVHSTVRRRAGAIGGCRLTPSLAVRGVLPEFAPAGRLGSTGAGDSSSGSARTATARTGTPRSAPISAPGTSTSGRRSSSPATATGTPHRRSAAFWRPRPRDDARPAHLDDTPPLDLCAGQRRARRRRRARDDPEPRSRCLRGAPRRGRARRPARTACRRPTPWRCTTGPGGGPRSACARHPRR